MVRCSTHIHTRFLPCVVRCGTIRYGYNPSHHCDCPPPRIPLMLPPLPEQVAPLTLTPAPVPLTPSTTYPHPLPLPLPVPLSPTTCSQELGLLNVPLPLPLPVPLPYHPQPRTGSSSTFRLWWREHGRYAAAARLQILKLRPLLLPLLPPLHKEAHHCRLLHSPSLRLCLNPSLSPCLSPVHRHCLSPVHRHCFLLYLAWA